MFINNVIKYVCTSSADFSEQFCEFLFLLGKYKQRQLSLLALFKFHENYLTVSSLTTFCNQVGNKYIHKNIGGSVPSLCRKIRRRRNNIKFSNVKQNFSPAISIS